jgi:hypothetical protein
MVAPRCTASPFRYLLAPALGAAFVFAPGCGGGDNPSRYAGTIDMPKREPSRVDAKDFAKEKAKGKVNND